ncbi:3-carboxy-cis,cis-muconate cycloisomerase [Devosia limi DSM 17137]|uniref:3-carboxy-cis,cis-muconate cycloisomerase n=1 Tax=Devosia limi DSM 17137 TaxID=1121477 RepID=A0A0F5LW07_9HYPH|nr:3-carboxy-cis,cis-muconate cycloisomerase [Devosia limi]KKB85842.1 3-carboxy-cis,cis-muconate cycloisomerase [Devosia limi DSM 17137]SHE35219.1 3-carboxy-cis,cis-muconate cycloisomerase [Devosia limi DSM 17137]
MTETKPSLLQSLVGDPAVAEHLSDAADLAAMLRFEGALAEAEADAGLIEADAAQAIIAAIAGFTPDWADLARGMARDGVVIPALVRQLRNAVGEPHGVQVHKGATSQDAIDTALILRLAQIIPIYEERLVALQAALAALSARDGALSLMAHTRMQQALKFTVAAKIRTWTEPLERLLAALTASRRQLLVIQLGGPIGDRSSFGDKGDAVARYLAERLDLGLAEPWHASRDPLVGFASLLSLITGALGKFGADVALLAQNEVGAIRLAGGGTSSAMAHKSNPVNAEVLVSLARYNAGLVGTLHQALVHENERSGAAWTLEWLALPQILQTTGASLRLANDLVGQIGFEDQSRTG